MRRLGVITSDAEVSGLSVLFVIFYALKFSFFALMNCFNFEFSKWNSNPVVFKVANVSALMACLALRFAID